MINKMSSVFLYAALLFVSLRAEASYLQKPGSGGGGGSVTLSSPLFNVAGSPGTTLALTFQGEYENIQSGPTITLNWNNGPQQRIDLAADIAITNSNMVSGGSYRLQLAQSASPSLVSFTDIPVQAWGSLGVPDLSTLAHDCWINIYFDVNKYGFVSATWSTGFCAGP